MHPGTADGAVRPSQRWTAEDRVYESPANEDVVGLVDADAVRVLDVGCGAGGNAALMLARDARKEIVGVTASAAEAKQASRSMRSCVVADLDHGVPAGLEGQQFDAIVFSHVLEHLRDPAGTVASFSRLLRVGGACIIAVPNVMHWRERAQFMLGRFEYQTEGILDETHLRFFTYDSAPRLLLARVPEFDLVLHAGSGNLPLGPVRRHLLSAGTAARLDQLACRLGPNLFGWQILLKAIKRRTAE